MRHTEKHFFLISPWWQSFLKNFHSKWKYSENPSKLSIDLCLNVLKNYKDLFKCLQYRDDKYCRNDAPLFLLIGGGITLGMTALKLVAWLTPCECDDKLANFLSPLANLANFCVLIWGSVVVFGKSFPYVLHFLNCKIIISAIFRSVK